MKSIFILISICISVVNLKGQSLPDLFNVNKVINVRNYSVKKEHSRPLVYTLFKNKIYIANFIKNGEFEISEYLQSKKRKRKKYRLVLPTDSLTAIESFNGIEVNENFIVLLVDGKAHIFNAINKAYLYSINVIDSDVLHAVLVGKMLYLSHWYRYYKSENLNHLKVYDLSNRHKSPISTYLDIQPDFFCFISPNSLIDFNHADSSFVIAQSNRNSFRVLKDSSWSPIQSFDQDESALIGRELLDTLNLLASISANRDVMKYCFKVFLKYKKQWNTAIYSLGNNKYYLSFNRGSEFNEQNGAFLIKTHNGFIDSILPYSSWDKLKDTALKTYYFLPGLAGESKQDPFSNRFVYTRRSAFCKVKKNKTILNYFQKNNKWSWIPFVNTYRLYICEWK